MYNLQFKPFNVKMESDPFHVDPNVRRHVLELHGTTEGMLEKDANLIKKWMKTQPHLPEIMEKAKIKNFLILNGCSIEIAKQKIDNYYTIRHAIPKIFANSNPKLENMQILRKNMFLFTFPKMTANSRVFFAKLREPDALKVYDGEARFFNIQELRLSEDCMTEDIILVDMVNFSIGDINGTTLSSIAKGFAVYDQVYSFPLRRMIIFNCPSYISKIMTIFKTVLKPHFFEKVEFHQDTKILHDILKMDELPKDYGGSGPSLQELDDMMEKKIEKHQKRFQMLDKLKVNEELRPQKLNNNDILGYYGTFK